MTDPTNNINISCSKSKAMQIVGTLKKNVTEEPRAEVVMAAIRLGRRAQRIQERFIKRAEDAETIEDLQLNLADEQTKTGDLEHSNEGLKETIEGLEGTLINEQIKTEPPGVLRTTGPLRRRAPLEINRSDSCLALRRQISGSAPRTSGGRSFGGAPLSSG
ncbi:hypothetical protein CF319_g4521 [Tilletia indica]|nr:hypothetical protein CF319_g4521 [Tilletia indica]